MAASCSPEPPWRTKNKERLRRSPVRSLERLLRRELVEGVLCGQTILVTVTDLLEKNCLIFIENECRRIGRLMRGIPTQAVRIGHRVIRIGDQNDIGGQLRLLRKKLFCMLIQVCGR